MWGLSGNWSTMEQTWTSPIRWIRLWVLWLPVHLVDEFQASTGDRSSDSNNSLIHWFWLVVASSGFHSLQLSTFQLLLTNDCIACKYHTQTKHGTPMHNSCWKPACFNHSSHSLLYWMLYFIQDGNTAFDIASVEQHTDVCQELLTQQFL